MAGGALGGVFGAALRLVPGYTEDWIKTPFYDNEPVSQIVSAAAVRRAVRLRLVRLRPQDPGGLTHDPRAARVDLAGTAVREGLVAPEGDLRLA